MLDDLPGKLLRAGLRPAALQLGDDAVDGGLGLLALLGGELGVEPDALISAGGLAVLATERLTVVLGERVVVGRLGRAGTALHLAHRRLLRRRLDRGRLLAGLSGRQGVDGLLALGPFGGLRGPGSAAEEQSEDQGSEGEASGHEKSFIESRGRVHSRTSVRLSSAADPGNLSPMIPATPDARLTLCGSLSLHAVSLGAAMHLAGYRALGLPFTYVPFQVMDVAGAITGMRALGIRGFGISMPYKQTVMPLLDALEPTAEAIGAVNTVVNDGGHLTGHNTDAPGAVRAFEEVRPLDGARVLLLGAGGAARAIAHGFAARGARVTIANRDRARATALAAATGARAAAGLDEANRAGSYDAVVNATSIGMSILGDADARSPIPEAALGPGVLVMDIVYKPIETELTRAARRRGAPVIHGGRMLLHQAARQFELYTGKEAPLEAMEGALLAQIGPVDPSS